MIAVCYRYALDIVRIHSGEVHPEDLSFITEEGRAIAELESIESQHKRDALREEDEWAATVPSEAAQGESAEEDLDQPDHRFRPRYKPDKLKHMFDRLRPNA